MRCFSLQLKNGSTVHKNSKRCALFAYNSKPKKKEEKWCMKIKLMRKSDDAEEEKVRKNLLPVCTVNFGFVLLIFDFNL